MTTDIVREANEYFSHNPSHKYVGFVMLNQDELTVVSDGDTLYINLDDVTVVHNNRNSGLEIQEGTYEAGIYGEQAEIKRKV